MVMPIKRGEAADRTGRKMCQKEDMRSANRLSILSCPFGFIMTQGRESILYIWTVSANICRTAKYNKKTIRDHTCGLPMESLKTTDCKALRVLHVLKKMH